MQPEQDILPEDNDNVAPEEVPQQDPLQAKIEELEKQAASYKDQALRAMAEAENVRKRASREMEDSARYATANFARDIVGVVENLQRASASVSAEQRGENDLLKTIGDGVDMVLGELMSTLQRHGVARIDPMGEKFNHQYHQAVAQVESDDMPPGMVTQVLQAGYLLHDRLLRPAMVTVAKAPAKKEEA